MGGSLKLPPSAENGSASADAVLLADLLVILQDAVSDLLLGDEDRTAVLDTISKLLKRLNRRVRGILDGSLHPMAAVPMTAVGDEVIIDTDEVEEPVQPGLSEEDKQRIMGQASRLDREIEARVTEADEYDDDFDDTDIGLPQLAAGGDASESEELDETNDQESSDEENERWANDRGRGGRIKGKGKGFFSGKGPVQGQTIGARRKEENKARVANHNRRDAAMRKLQRAM